MSVIPIMISGLTYVPNVLTEELEGALLEELDEGEGGQVGTALWLSVRL